MNDVFKVVGLMISIMLISVFTVVIIVFESADQQQIIKFDIVSCAIFGLVGWLIVAVICFLSLNNKLKIEKKQFNQLATEFLKFLAKDHDHKFNTTKDALDYWTEKAFK